MLIIFIPFTILVFYLLNRYISFEAKNKVNYSNDSKHYGGIKNATFYVIGLLLDQGRSMVY